MTGPSGIWDGVYVRLRDDIIVTPRPTARPVPATDPIVGGGPSIPCPTCDGGNMIGVGPCPTCLGLARVYR